MTSKKHFIFQFIKNLLISSLVIWLIGNLNVYIYNQFFIQLWIVPLMCSILLLLVCKLFSNNVLPISIVIISISLSVFNIMDLLIPHCDFNLQPNVLSRLIGVIVNAILFYYIIISYWKKFNNKHRTIILLVTIIMLWSINFMDYGISRIFN